MSEEKVLEQSPLGSDTAYVNQYDATLLFPILRSLNWEKRGIERSTLPFQGEDIWNGYEVSWLNMKGKPVVRVACFRVPAGSPYIIESKSFKLYLNSFNLSRFSDDQEVMHLMEKDLSAVAGADVRVSFSQPDSLPAVGCFQGECLDELDIEVTSYEPDVNWLSVNPQGQNVTQSLFSHLLKSNCPVTGQPDWASIEIRYSGVEIDREGLLKYLISYREHGDFHEQCVENIFMDIWQQCQPKTLTVYARYVRRGGLDINPFRSSDLARGDNNTRLGRQ